MDSKEAVRLRLKEAAERSGLNPKEIAYRAKIKKRTYDGWISANPSTPSAIDLAKVCEAIGETVEYIALGKNNKWKPPPRIAGIVENLQMLNDEQLKLVEIQVQALADSLKIQRETTMSDNSH